MYTSLFYNNGRALAFIVRRGSESLNCRLCSLKGRTKGKLNGKNEHVKLFSWLGNIFSCLGNIFSRLGNIFSWLENSFFFIICLFAEEHIATLPKAYPLPCARYSQNPPPTPPRRGEGNTPSYTPSSELLFVHIFLYDYPHVPDRRPERPTKI